MYKLSSSGIFKTLTILIFSIKIESKMRRSYELGYFFMVLSCLFAFITIFPIYFNIKTEDEPYFVVI